MYTIAQATYRNGNLILNKKLGSEMEGRTLNVVIFEVNDVERKKEQFFEFVDKIAFPLPESYKFNRDEIYDR